MESYTARQKRPIMKSLFVYEEIKNLLFNGGWEFGETIDVNGLIKRFNVSRRPVMDALKMLENEGFIEIIPQSGCKVISYSKKEVIDQLMLSSALESLCAELAALNRTDDEIESLKVFQKKMLSDPIRMEEKSFFFSYNREFHFHIFSMAHSEKIKNLALQMGDLNDFYLMNLFEEFEFDNYESVGFHNKLVTFIENRDSANAKKTMEEHFKNYIEKLKDKLF